MRHKPTHGGRSNRDPFCSPADSGKAIDLLHFGTICGFMQVETGTGDSATSVDAKTLDPGHRCDYVCTIANANATDGASIPTSKGSKAPGTTNVTWSCCGFYRF